MTEFLEGFSGMQDNFQRLWTPHRLVYLQTGQQPPDEECPFCLAPGKTPEEGLVVYKGESCYVLMNLFPYNTGHLLVCPYRHVDTYDKATAEEIQEIGKLTQQGMRTLKKVFGTDGFNIGMNQGAVAGAGIASHLHQHIVPRWKNDANFFPIIAETKALPRLLGEVRAEIQAAWATVK